MKTMPRLFFLFVVHMVTLATGTNSGKLEHSSELYSPTLRKRPASYKLIKTTSPPPFALHPAVLLFRDSEITQSSPSMPLPTQRLTEEHKPDFVGVKELLQKYRHALEAAIEPKDTSDPSIDAEDGNLFYNARKTNGRHSGARHTNPGSKKLNTGVLIESNGHLDINERLNKHTKVSIDVSKSHHGGTQAGKSRLDESESRNPRPTEVRLAPGQISMRGRGNLERFTGINKPKQLLPPSQRTETTTNVPVFAIPDTQSHLKPNIRARKAKRVRFGRKRRPGRRRKENVHRQQEILKPVTVINRPRTTLPPFTIPPNYEYGKKEIKAIRKAEELPLHVGDKGNITLYYPQALASAQKPTVEIRKYSLLAESKPKSVTVNEPPVAYSRGVFLWGERLGNEHTRTRVKGKARRVTVDGYEMKLEEPVAPAIRESEAREAIPDPRHGRFLAPLPAGINGPSLYFLPAEDESKSPPWGEEGSYITEKPRQTEIRTEDGSLHTFEPSPSLPPSYRSAERGVDKPLYIPIYDNFAPLVTSVSPYEPLSTPFPHTIPFATTTTTLRPPAPPRPFPSTRPSPPPPPPPPPFPHVNDVTGNQITHETSTGELARKLAAVTSFTCAGRLPGHHADTETGCKNERGGRPSAWRRRTRGG
ncbi:uncharacterized protein LOC126999323 isoform X2 [Eriocheir sinensis]|uniref:uncharacterized protein LOC126999323 isoform X2 n=1 Tax=Eriocheir sinensis TaxID=95602 RepID=UPI0021C7A7FF|nr:uncharacterized protein LOC126999323 isoform X2 [Eriocheir sinensis]